MVDQAERAEDVAWVDGLDTDRQGGQAAGKVVALLPSHRALRGPVGERVKLVAQGLVHAGSNLLPPRGIGTKVVADQRGQPANHIRAAGPSRPALSQQGDSAREVAEKFRHGKFLKVS